MLRISLILALSLFLATPPGAQETQCPETHYPCGTGSCCSK